MEEKKNCKNCGAPLNKDGDCEYCGTKRQRRPHSSMVITASEIRLYAGDECICDEERTFNHIAIREFREAITSKKERMTNEYRQSDESA